MLLRKVRIGPLAALALLLPFARGGAATLESPNGRVRVEVELQDLDGATGCPVYRVTFDGRLIIADARLGLELKNTSLASEFQLMAERRRDRATTWQPVTGERAEIPDVFHELVLDLRQASTGRRLRLDFRAYDEGMAFCYEIPGSGEEIVITREVTQFAFTGDHTAWAVYRAQGNYDPADPRRQSAGLKTGPVRLSELKPGVERPLTVRVADDCYAAVTEARLVDYARMKLQPTPNRAHTLEPRLDGERGATGQVVGRAPFTTPWRVLLLAKSPGGLLEQNYLVPNLNAPCALEDTSWIRPGKVIREATLTTAGGKACVDFAATHGLQFIEYDAGWYGPENDPASDARAVHLDPKRNPVPGSLNLREVIDYANAHGIGVILYVNHLALERQREEIFPLYERWGVKGVKFGFVNVGSQQWTEWLHQAIRRAADYHLMVDIHDEFRSTGEQRTYPNLMTVEGISGNEEFPTPVHNATLPFTRFLTGPADYTYCWSNSRLKVTKAHQLALSTIYFSPWQFLYWYDRPASVAEEPALDYWRDLPTTWDETRVLEGDIGRRAVVARRKGDAWFVGAIAPVDGRFDISLGFLPPGRTFRAVIYRDAADGKSVTRTEREVSSSTVLAADLAPNGGLAVQLQRK